MNRAMVLVGRDWKLFFNILSLSYKQKFISKFYTFLIYPFRYLRWKVGKIKNFNLDCIKLLDGIIVFKLLHQSQSLDLCCGEHNPKI